MILSFWDGLFSGVMLVSGKIYLPTWTVDFYSKLVGKYASPMDPMGQILSQVHKLLAGVGWLLCCFLGHPLCIYIDIWYIYIINMHRDKLIFFMMHLMLVPNSVNHSYTSKVYHKISATKLTQPYSQQPVDESSVFLLSRAVTGNPP